MRLKRQPHYKLFIYYLKNDKKNSSIHLVITFLAAVSCKKTDDSAATVVTTDQVADIAAGALGLNTTGLTNNFDDIAINVQSVSSISGPAKTINTTGPGLPGPQCGITLTDSIAKTGTSNAITFTYFLKYTHTLNCNTNYQPDNVSYNLAFHTACNYSGPYVTAVDTGSSSFIIAGFTTGSTVFSMNGTYNRKGAFTSKVGNKISGTSVVAITVTNLICNKIDKDNSGWHCNNFNYDNSTKKVRLATMET